jgi:hypothetical protein
VVAVCLASAAGSLLLLPSVPSYDAWSWLNWGWQIVHLDLSTTGGSAWKPLPVLSTTVFAAFGEAAPWLWIVIARAGGLLALAMAFRVARRLVGGGVGGAFAGVVAAAGLALSPEFVRSFAVATSEGLVMTLTLLAVERHLARRYRHAFVAGFFVGLLRPDWWPLLAIYGLWLVARDRPAWRLALGLGALLPALWFLPEWWGSGDPWRSARLARQLVPRSYTGEPDPVPSALSGAWDAVPPAIRWGVGLAILADLGALIRRRACPRLLLIIAAALTWMAAVVTTVARGYVATPRYFMGSAALLAVAGAAGWARWIGAGRRLAGSARWTWAPTAVVATAVLASLVASGLGQRGELEHTADDVQWLAKARDALPTTLAQAGGPEQILSCGAVSGRNTYGSILAWYLHIPVKRVLRHAQPQGYVIQAPTTLTHAFRPEAPRNATMVAATKYWRVLAVGCGRVPAHRAGRRTPVTR